MKRKSFSGFFAGMLTTLLIVAMVGSVSATTGKVTKEIEYRNISVSLDGKKLDLKDAKGNTVEPFMFDGTNYIPARALAESLGLSVAWDSSTSTVVLKSSAGSSAEPPSNTATTSDGLVAENSGVKIYYHGISKSDSFLGGYDVNLKIVNDSKEDVTVQVRDLSVNGIMTSSIFSCDVAAGKTAIDEINLYKSALDKNGISSVEKVGFKFHVFDSKTWETVFDTQELTVNK